MAPSATDPPAQAPEQETVIPPPNLYTPREGRFENFVEVQADGYRQAKSRGPQRAAIVIDNGICPLRLHPELILKYARQALQLPEQAGLSKTRPDSMSSPYTPNIETGSWERHTRSLVQMFMPTRRRVDT